MVGQSNRSTMRKQQPRGGSKTKAGRTVTMNPGGGGSGSGGGGGESNSSGGMNRSQTGKSPLSRSHTSKADRAQLEQKKKAAEEAERKRLHEQKLAAIRKVKLRDDPVVRCSLRNDPKVYKWDEHWVPDLEPFQLPQPMVEAAEKAGGAFAKQKKVHGWEVEGHEETVAFSWGWGGEGRLGSGSGAQDKLVPTLVNKAPNTTTRFVDAAAGKRHSLAVSEEGVVYAWGDGASGQLGSFRVPKRKVEESESESGEEEEEKEETKGSARARAKAKADAKLDAKSQPKGKDGKESKGKEKGKKGSKDKKDKKHAAPTGSNALALAAAGKHHGGENPHHKPKPPPPKAHGSLTDMLMKGKRQMMRRPTAVMPTGRLKRGRDYVMHQVEAGARASYAREANREEGIDAVEGLKEMTSAISQMVLDYPESEGLRELKTYLTEEYATIGRAYTGDVFAWGTGERGELGLGDQITYRPRPTRLSGLERMSVSQLAAGMRHVLCTTADGLVFSWGFGRDGRLGHDDYNDRAKPTMIEALRHTIVNVIAAGDAHSLAVSSDLRPDPEALDGAYTGGGSRPASRAGVGTPGSGRKKLRKLTAHEQKCKAFPTGVYTWGRGAHGRLGHGANLTRRIPTLIETWPDSYDGFHVTQAALGGAHSLVLADKKVHPGLVNPWGVQRYVYSFGYGFNGQLGTDSLVDSFSPKRVKIPKWELVRSLTAGKSHSMALTVHGDMYVWGKGWVGELGLGNRHQVSAPIKLDASKSNGPMFLKMYGGDRHSLGIALRRKPKHLDNGTIERKPPNQDLVYLGLPRVETTILNKWLCARRSPISPLAPGAARSKERQGQMYRCVTCNLEAVCRTCILWCHKRLGHNIQPRMSGQTTRTLCSCSTGTNCQVMVCVCEEVDQNRHEAATHIQRLGRAWLARRILAGKRNRLRLMRHEVSTRVWNEAVMNPVRHVISEFTEVKGAEHERLSMAMNDKESWASRHYLKLQVLLQALETQRRAIGTLVSMTGILDPHPSAEPQFLDPDKLKFMTRAAREHLHLTAKSPYTRHRTRQSLRQAQREYRQDERMKERDLLNLTRDIPAYGTVGARVPDIDVSQFVRVAEEEPRIKRRVSIASPSDLYDRVVKVRHQQKRNLEVHRRQSFDLGAKVDKTVSEEDTRWTEFFGDPKKDAIKNSLKVATLALLPARLEQNMLSIELVPNKDPLLDPAPSRPPSKSAKALAYSKYPYTLVPFVPRMPDVDMKVLIPRSKEWRLEAEEYKAAKIAEEERKKEEEANALFGYPGSGGGGGSRPGSKEGGSRDEPSTVGMSLGSRSAGGRSMEGGLYAGDLFGGGNQLEDARAGGLDDDPNNRRRRRRGHSIAAPERLRSHLSIWQRHHELVRGLGINPIVNYKVELGVKRWQHHASHRSGVRSADKATRVERATRFGANAPYEVEQMEREDWETEGLCVNMMYENSPVMRRQRAKEAAIAKEKAEEEARLKRKSRFRREPDPKEKEKVESKEAEAAEAEDGIEEEKGDEADAAATDAPDDAAAADDGAANADGGDGDWIEAWDDQGNVYYMNQVTGETSWDKPAGMVVGDGAAAAAAADAYGYDSYGPSADAQYQYDEYGGYWDENGVYQAPEGGDYQYQEEWPAEGGGEADGDEWQQLQDEHGNWYWYNSQTGESQW